MSPAMMVISSEEENEFEIEYQKGVKNLSEKGISRLPNKYIFPPLERPSMSLFEIKNTIKCKNNILELPIIDFTKLQGSNRSQLLKSLSYACENYGFFQVVNHGIPNDVISGMMDVSKRFFELPNEEREIYMNSDLSSPVRYGTSFNQTNDGSFSWRDFLKLICPPLPHMLPLWPSSPLDFRKLAVTYANENKNLFLMLMEAILESLGVVENTTNNNKTTNEDDDVTTNNNNNCNNNNNNNCNSRILEELEDGSQLMVVNCYPACPEPELTLGIPPHSDYGFLTLLLQDDVEGLQIMHQDKWVNIHPIPNSFVVNVGDHLEIFSNGKYKSVLHRATVNSTRSRLSIASLHTVSAQTVVRPSPKLINEANPRRYMDTDFNIFLKYITSCESKMKNFLESRKINCHSDDL